MEDLAWWSLHLPKSHTTKSGNHLNLINSRMGFKIVAHSHSGTLSKEMWTSHLQPHATWLDLTDAAHSKRSQTHKWIPSDTVNEITPKLSEVKRHHLWGVWRSARASRARECSVSWAGFLEFGRWKLIDYQSCSVFLPIGELHFKTS